jgi:hypothetical protein
LTECYHTAVPFRVAGLPDGDRIVLTIVGTAD